MGNNTPSLENRPGITGHERLGLIQTMEAPKNASLEEEDCAELMVLRNRAVSKSDLASWHDNIKALKLGSIRQMLLLPVGEEIVSGGYCGSSCHVDLRYPHYSIVLRDEIKNRWKIDKMYEEAELWFLLYHLACVGRHFEAQGRKIGNVHPLNILINDSGFMKIISAFSIPNENDNFALICESQLEDVFLAPQEIDYDCIKRNMYPPHVDPNRAELFSMGMTMLEAGCLELSTYTYDKGPYRVNFNKVTENLNIFRHKYDSKLYKIVESLVAVNPKDRTSCKEIYAMLNPHRNEILSMEPFDDNSRKPEEIVKYGDSLHYSKSSDGLNQTTLLNANQSYSELAETKVLYPSSQPFGSVSHSIARPLPINQPRQRYTNPPNQQIRFYSPRNDTLFRRY